MSQQSPTQTPQNADQAHALLTYWATYGAPRFIPREALEAMAKQLKPHPAPPPPKVVPPDALTVLLRPVREELQRAVSKFPLWPTDPFHASNILGEEFGELVREVNQLAYEPELSNREKVRVEAVQTVAMALRFLAGLGHYRYERAKQVNTSATLGVAPK